MKNKILGDILRKITERAAIASYNWIGKGDNNSGDLAAVEVMRANISSLGLLGKIVIGEGEKDDAPQLYNGEIFGKESDPGFVDIAVDPIEGTSFLSKGLTNALSTMAVAPKGTMFNPGPAFYMEKFASSAKTLGKIDMSWTVEKKIKTVADLLEKKVEKIVVYVLDKPRHKTLIQDIYAAGAKVSLYPAGDVTGALLAAIPDSEVDILMGTGGTPEGALSACAIRAIGGEFLGRLNPQLLSEKRELKELNLDTDKWYKRDELVTSDRVFFSATGITSGILLDGVQKTDHGFTTQTLVISGPDKERLKITNWHEF